MSIMPADHTDTLSPEERRDYLVSLATDLTTELETIEANEDEVVTLLSRLLIGYCLGLGESRLTFVDRMQTAYDKHKEELKEELLQSKDTLSPEAPESPALTPDEEKTQP